MQLLVLSTLLLQIEGQVFKLLAYDFYVGLVLPEVRFQLVLQSFDVQLELMFMLDVLT